MGVTCSKHNDAVPQTASSAGTAPAALAEKKQRKSKRNGGLGLTSDSASLAVLDPLMHDLMKESVALSQQNERKFFQQQAAAAQDTTLSLEKGQSHLLFHPKQQEHALSNDSNLYSSADDSSNNKNTLDVLPTRLVVRRRQVRNEEGMSGTHMYAIRYPSHWPLKPSLGSSNSKSPPICAQEQHPGNKPNNLQQIQSNESVAFAARSNVIASGVLTDSKTCKDDEIPGVTFTNTTTTKPTTATTTTGTQNNTNKQTVDSDKAATTSNKNDAVATTKTVTAKSPDSLDMTNMFDATVMAMPPIKQIYSWMTVSDEHGIYIADLAMTTQECHEIIQSSEQSCRGQYAAYTYAKQTLGCREYPVLARACQPAVHAVTHAILTKLIHAKQSASNKQATTASGDFNSKDENKTQQSSSIPGHQYDSLLADTPAAQLQDANGKQQRSSPPQHKASSAPTASSNNNPSPQQLVLDDREPHIVKYDVSKKERQKLDMHTDKSEWTFLISLSNGCGLDYEGGGTYLECLDATIHIPKGMALIFPGRLRHCGQRITRGLRFLLVGFLVEKNTKIPMAPMPITTTAADASTVNKNRTTTTTTA